MAKEKKTTPKRKTQKKKKGKATKASKSAELRKEKRARIAEAEALPNRTRPLSEDEDPAKKKKKKRKTQKKKKKTTPKKKPEERMGRMAERATVKTRREIAVEDLTPDELSQLSSSKGRATGGARVIQNEDGTFTRIPSAKEIPAKARKGGFAKFFKERHRKKGMSAFMERLKANITETHKISKRKYSPDDYFTKSVKDMYEDLHPMTRQMLVEHGPLTKKSDLMKALKSDSMLDMDLEEAMDDVDKVYKKNFRPEGRGTLKSDAKLGRMRKTKDQVKPLTKRKRKSKTPIMRAKDAKEAGEKTAARYKDRRSSRDIKGKIAFAGQDAKRKRREYRERDALEERKLMARHERGERRVSAKEAWASERSPDASAAHRSKGRERVKDARLERKMAKKKVDAMKALNPLDPRALMIGEGRVKLEKGEVELEKAEPEVEEVKLEKAEEADTKETKKEGKKKGKKGKGKTKAGKMTLAERVKARDGELKAKKKKGALAARAKEMADKAREAKERGVPVESLGDEAAEWGAKSSRTGSWADLDDAKRVQRLMEWEDVRLDPAKGDAAAYQKALADLAEDGLDPKIIEKLEGKDPNIMLRALRGKDGKLAKELSRIIPDSRDRAIVKQTLKIAAETAVGSGGKAQAGRLLATIKKMPWPEGAVEKKTFIKALEKLIRKDPDALGKIGIKAFVEGSLYDPVADEGMGSWFRKLTKRFIRKSSWVPNPEVIPEALAGYKSAMAPGKDVAKVLGKAGLGAGGKLLRGASKLLPGIGALTVMGELGYTAWNAWGSHQRAGEMARSMSYPGMATPMAPAEKLRAQLERRRMIENRIAAMNQSGILGDVTNSLKYPGGAMSGPRAGHVQVGGQGGQGPASMTDDEAQMLLEQLAVQMG